MPLAERSLLIHLLNPRILETAQHPIGPNESAKLTEPRDATATRTTMGSDPRIVADDPSRAVNAGDASLPDGV
jgi:hypothetical protein